MPATWWLALIYPLPLLLIPLAVLLGQHIRIGAVAVMSGSAALLAGVFWLILLGVIVMRISSNSFVNGQVEAYVEVYAALLAIVLLVCAWTLALAEAFRERRWGWVAAQCLADYLTFASVFVYLTGPYFSCYSNPDLFICVTVNQSVGAILIACMFAGPLALLAYALRRNLLLHTRARPDDLAVSRLDAK
ncbi:MAG TPA: hypothetical protein VF792_13355 [Ktedonobacterales bacterium]